MKSNQTKTTFSMVLAIAVTLFVVSGCKKDSGPNLVSGGFNGTISATVENEAEYVNYVVAWNDGDLVKQGGSWRLLGTQVGQPAAYNGSSFTVNLPNPPSSSEVRMVSVKSYFENESGIEGPIKYSDPDVRITDIDILGWYIEFNGSGSITASYALGGFINITSDEETVCQFIYAEDDVTVTAGKNLSVSLKQGWNRVYVSDKEITTKPRSDLKWYYFEFELD